MTCCSTLECEARGMCPALSGCPAYTDAVVELTRAAVSRGERLPAAQDTAQDTRHRDVSCNPNEHALQSPGARSRLASSFSGLRSAALVRSSAHRCRAPLTPSTPTPSTSKPLAPIASNGSARGREAGRVLTQAHTAMLLRSTQPMVPLAVMHGGSDAIAARRAYHVANGPLQVMCKEAWHMQGLHPHVQQVTSGRSRPCRFAGRFSARVERRLPSSNAEPRQRRPTRPRRGRCSMSWRVGKGALKRASASQVVGAKRRRRSR